MKLKLALLCLLTTTGIFLQQAIGQDLKVSGKVSNRSTGKPVPGSTISIKGSAVGTTSDDNGNFSIIAKKGATLVVSYTGMTPVEYVVRNNDAPVEIIMQESASNTLQDVVVVGYGTQKVTKVSGAISTVRSADIQKLNPVRVEEALQGSVSGVNIIQSGSPGVGPTIFIRGIPDLSGKPTVIVDGVEQTTDDLNSINPTEIESVSVLKDASATAIYGVKGGNGVIVITTKSGRKNQKTDITLNSSYSIQQVIRTLPVLNATEYGAMLNEGSTLSGGSVIFPDLSVLGVGTDWQKQVFNNAPLQTHNISARGGSDKMTYFVSGGYLQQGGILGGYDKSRFNRLNFTSNVSIDLTSNLKFIVDATYLNFDGRSVAENAFNSILGSAINFDPTVSIYNTVPNTVGKYGFSNLITREVYNPLTKLDNTYNTNAGNKLYGKFEFQYEPIKNLRLSARYGYTKYDGNSKSFDPLVFWGLNNTGNTLNADGSTISGLHNSVSHTKATFANYNIDLFANYNFTLFSKHHLETTVGMTLSKGSGNTAGASKQDVPYNSWQFADFTAATGNTTNNNTNGLTGYYFQYFNKHASGFGRVNYDYEEKYLASFTARRDGSYAFGVDNKFATFLSGSLGWVVSKEDFFKSNFINFLKIRGSYGSVGSDNGIDPRKVLVTIQTDYLASLYGSGNSIGYTFGNVFFPGSTIASAANSALRWEKQIQSNAGFEATFYKNKFNISADYFTKTVDGLLFTPSLSAYLGTIPPPPANIGSTKSSGVDITLGFNSKIIKDLGLNTSLTFTTVKNLVTKTGDNGAYIFGGGYFNGQSQNVTIFGPGQTPAAYFGYKTAGLFQTQAEIDKSPKQNGAKPGDIKFQDLNGDGVIDSKDQTVIGNPFPKFTMGWNLGLTYKNFDFSAFTYASSGNDIYMAFERNDTYTNKYRGILSRWTGPGTTNDARSPRYTFTDVNNNSRVSDRYVTDGSFVKVKNLLVGYNIPLAAVKKVFRSVRVYAQVKNPFTFTRYNGLDPEIAGGGLLDTGVDRGTYPQARTYSFGLDIKF